MADRVLVVEDDPDLRVTTRLILEKQGFDVSVAEDGMAGLEAALLDPPDVAVVDVVMPRMDGLTLTRKLHAELNVPVILLTARDLPGDEISGLDAGAAYYVTKPFDGDVLAARIRAVLRQARTAATATEDETVADLVINRAGMTVHRDGEELGLTATEFRLLSVLLDHRNAVLSREQLLDHVWGDPGWGAERIVDVNIQRLRAKIGNDVISTVRGAGYKLVVS